MGGRGLAALRRRAAQWVMFALATAVSAARAAPIYVPNASFESPVIRESPFARPDLADWQQAPPPDWWIGMGYTAEDWDNTTGVFYNVPDVPTWIDNVDGEQAAFLFSTPGVEIYQDLAATFEAGLALRLTVGLQGGGMGMPLGTPLELRLYYRDDDGVRVTVGSTVAVNTTDESQPHLRHLDDWQLEIAVVSPSDPWAGKNIGIQIISPPQSPGGFWRVDNVRLEVIPEPAAAALLAAGLLLAERFRKRGARDARQLR